MNNGTGAAQPVRLLGLDFGSTTSSLILAEVSITRHSVTGRMGYGDPTILLQTEPVFTPFKADQLDQSALMKLLDDWLRQCGGLLLNESRSAQVASAQNQVASGHTQIAGAALITGLAARSDNAQTLRTLIGERIGDSLIAAADDPSLESWLAFMGSCATLSRAHPDRPVINLDIGGGTTNPALGLAGQVQQCGCAYIGARHVRFEPDSYCLSGYSDLGHLMLIQLGLPTRIGQSLDDEQIQTLVGFQVQALEALALGDSGFFRESHWRSRLVQVPFVADPDFGPEDQGEQGEKDEQRPLICFSGGVGELIYRHHLQQDWPDTNRYSDLGIELAKAICRSPILARDLDHRPEQAGRATVMGLTLHSSEVSGASLYLSDQQCLPLRDLPILSRLPASAGFEQWLQALMLARSCPAGACIAIEQTQGCDHAGLKQLAEHIRLAVVRSEFPQDQPLALLLDSNLGKTLGQYICQWGKSPLALYVIDEIPLRQARFAQIGRPHQHIVPVSFFGMH